MVTAAQVTDGSGRIILSTTGGELRRGEALYPEGVSQVWDVSLRAYNYPKTQSNKWRLEELYYDDNFSLLAIYLHERAKFPEALWCHCFYGEGVAEIQIRGRIYREQRRKIYKKVLDRNHLQNSKSD